MTITDLFQSHAMKPGSGLKSAASIDVDDMLPQSRAGGLGRADHSLSKSIAELNGTEELLPSACHPPPCLKRPLAL